MLLWTAWALLPSTAEAQNTIEKRLQRQQQEMQKRIQQQMKTVAENQPQLPADPQLLSLHKEFITKAEKLAGEYERKKELERAREVYEAMVRLVPKYQPAELGLERILRSQLMKDRKLTEVLADQGWQDSGATLQQGMPVHVEVKGVWKVVLQTGPEGVVVPEEARPRDGRIKFGTLIGVIATSPGDLEKEKPFVVENNTEFTADKSGQLFLRMYDLDPTDNEGKMLVLIQSTFGK
ncbi:hypothetical protein [Stieleria varia]|uniref:hypothetical protein n=1 Tax=Stieleria varia TaxID=2528005 RepID=UPI0011B68DDD|nr:hypothetical protein [Stieleria varia]